MIQYKTRKCLQCGTEFLPKSANGGDLICSIECQKARKKEAREKKLAIALETGIIHGRSLKQDRYLTYQKRANSKNKHFGITQEEFNTFWQKPCYYCGSPIELIGIDRVDNNIGYVIGNIVPCCLPCNMMKRHGLVMDFIAHCKKIAALHD